MSTATRIRSDVHAPSQFIPENYSYVGGYDGGGLKVTKREHDLIQLVINSGTRLGQCTHCGAHIRYAAVMRHTSGQYILAGETCLDNRFSVASSDFRAMKRAAEEARKEQRIVKGRAAFVAANPDLAFLNDGTSETISNGFLASLSSQLRHNGELSVRQIDAARKSVAKDAAYAAEKAVREAAAPPVTPVVEGRQIVTGEILMVKCVDGAYGTTVKMMVRDDRGFRVWGTVPASIDTGELRGKRVTFTATVEASRDDKSFGYYNRPTQARAV